MPTTTFDPGILLNGGSLSGGNLIFTSTTTGNVVSNRPLTGLTYAEITCTTATGTPSVGVVGRNWASVPVGNDATSVGYASSGAVKFNGVTLATLATFTSADRIGIAVDWWNRLIWFRKNGGIWNGNALNDPATGVGGLSFASTNFGSTAQIGTALFGCATTASGTVWTANFSGAFVDTAPSGFVTIDTVQITLARSVDPEEVYSIIAPSVTAIAQISNKAQDNRTLQMFSPAGVITHVSGTIMEVGVAVGGKRVDVYDRATGELLGTTFSAVDGTWSIACLGRPTVRVVADDPTTYNSLVYDNVPAV